MNRCAMQEKLFAFYDGELAGSERREIESHLAGCPACRQAFTQWQRTAKALFRVSQIDVSEAFIGRVMARLEVLERPRRAVPRLALTRWLVPAMGVAGLWLLVIGSTPRGVSVETLLLADGRVNAPTAFVLASEPPTTDQLFGVMMEGQP